MPRLPQWPPHVQHHKRSGQARCRVSGQDYYLGPYGSPEAQAAYAALLSRLVREGQQGPTESRPAGPCLLICDVLARWAIHARGYYSERGREEEQFVLAVRPLERLFGQLPAREFDPAKLRQLQQAMLDGSWMTTADRAHHRSPQTGGLSRPTANSRIKRIRTVWRWAENAGLVAPGSWEALRAVEPIRRNRPGARDPVRARTTSMIEVRAICRHLSPLVRALLLVQYWSGMRSCEVRIMRAGDVTGSTYRPRQHKTDYLGHERSITLGPRALAALRPWLARAAAQGPDATVFPSPRGGQPWSRDGYCHAIRRAAKLVGLLHFHPYLCRHATRMRVSRIGGDEAARAVLGQRHLDTTLRYGSLDRGLAEDIQKRCG